MDPLTDSLIRQETRRQFFRKGGLGLGTAALASLLPGGRARADDEKDVSDKQGRPVVALAGGVRDVCEESGICDLQISIAHCRSHATAYALAWCEEIP